MPEDAAKLIVGRYTVLEKLGEGTFGYVVKAHDTRLKRIVAVKVLKRNANPMYPDRVREIQERFVREAEAGARIGTHANVVQVFDLVTDDAEIMHLILEFISGGTLAQRIQNAPIPPVVAMRWIAEVARGLHGAHEVGIIHRDVKPSNIFISGDERALIGDFGIAQIDSLSNRTNAQLYHPGTPLYMSPEQTQSTGYVRPSSDQYSLGLVSFELLVGMPYKRLESHDAAAVLAALPKNIMHFLTRMSAADPTHRYNNMMDVAAAAQAIERSLEHDAVSIHVPPTLLQGANRSDWPPGSEHLAPLPFGSVPAVSPPRDTRPHEPTRLHRRALLVSIGGLVATSVSGGLWLGRHSGQSRPGVIALPAGTTVPISASQPGGAPSPAPAIQANTTVPPVATTAPTPTTPTISAVSAFTLAGHTDGVVGIAFALDGKTLATGSLDNTARLWNSSDGTALHGSLTHPSGVRSVAISPDGTVLASGALDNQVRLWRTSSGESIRPLIGHQGPVYGVAFAPDGQTIASASADKTIKIWKVSDGTTIRTISGHVDGIFALAFAPDGQTIASASADKTIKIWKVSDGTTVQTFLGHTDNVNGVAFSSDGKMIASVSSDKRAIIWNASDTKVLHGHLLHPGTAFAVAFAPNGRSIATGSDDKTVRLWSTVDGSQIGSLDGHTAGVRSVSFAPDGKTLATASVDKTGRIWRFQ